ncbi:MAG TPA: transcriptional regulator [Lentisphaeria bacterium]|jgi:nitrogen regulatory protein P-II 1|nr:transcriptional regulator [Lentisphaeria bacterium]
MKLIIAFVQPERTNAVKQALHDAGITKMSVNSSLGCGQQMGFEEHYRGNKVEINLLKKARFEVGVNEEFVDKAVEAIVSGAKTGQIGDGKIFVLPVEQCIRIRTGETGGDAVG